MNAPTIIVAIIVFAILGFVIGKAIYDRAHGKSGGCGCGCGSCPSSGLCHPSDDKKKKSKS